MKQLTNNIFKQLEDLFNGKIDPCQFSCDFPDYCYKYYDEIESECAGLGYYLDQKVPYICDEGEPGFDPTHMIAELKKVYEEAKTIYNKSN